MPRFVHTFPRVDGGVDLSVPPDALSPDKTPWCHNMVFEDGTVRKRLGYSDYGSQLTGTVMLLEEFRMLDGTILPMALTTRGLWSYVSATGTDRTNSTLTAVADDYHSAATMLDQWVFSNGRDVVQYWDGSAASVSNLSGGDDYQTLTTHIAKRVLAWENRLHLFNTTEDGTDCPQRHRYSELGSMTRWRETGEGGGFNDLVEDPSGIVGAQPHGTSVLIFKPYSIVVLRYIGSAHFGYDTLTTQQGCSCPRTIRGTSEITFFLGRDNIYAVAGGKLTPIGDPIWPELRDNTPWDELVRAHAIVIPSQHEYRLFVPLMNSDMNRMYIYDYDTGKWTISHVPLITASGLAAVGVALTWGDLSGYTWGELADKTWGDFQAQSGREYLLMGDYSGYVYQADGLSRNDASNVDGHTTTAIDAWWSTGDMTGVPDRKHPVVGHMYKRFTEVVFEAKGHSVCVDFSTDSGHTWTLGDAVTLDPTQWAEYHAYFDSYQTPQCRVRWRNDVSSETFALRSASVRGTLMGDR